MNLFFERLLFKLSGIKCSISSFAASSHLRRETIAIKKLQRFLLFLLFISFSISRKSKFAIARTKQQHSFSKGFKLKYSFGDEPICCRTHETRTRGQGSCLLVSAFLLWRLILVSCDLQLKPVMVFFQAMSLKDRAPVAEPMSSNQVLANLAALAQIDDYQLRQQQPQQPYARQFSFPPEPVNSMQQMYGRTNSVNYGGPWARNGQIFFFSSTDVNVDDVACYERFFSNVLCNEKLKD